MHKIGEFTRRNSCNNYCNISCRRQVERYVRIICILIAFTQVKDNLTKLQYHQLDIYFTEIETNRKLVVESKQWYLRTRNVSLLPLRLKCNFLNSNCITMT